MSRLAGSLDTNVLLRLIVGDIPEQREQVLELLVAHNGEQFAIADIAIIETSFVLERYYEMPRQMVRELMHGIMSRPELINCNRILFDKALQQYAEHPALSLEDCCLCVYAELNNAAPLYTFDKKLAGQISSAQSIC